MKLGKEIRRDKYPKLASNYNFMDEDLHLYGYQGGDCLSNKALLKGIDKKGLHQVSPDKIILSHKLSTTGDNSGSPIFIKRKGEIGVIALHKGSPSPLIN